MHYSYNGIYPSANKPDRIRLSTGLTRTDADTITTDELIDAGWLVVEDPPNYDQTTHKLTWTGTDWDVSALTADELAAITADQWQMVREERNEKLNEFDWRLIRNLSEVRLSLTPTDDITKLGIYCQALRDITDQTDPTNITWPTWP